MKKKRYQSRRNQRQRPLILIGLGALLLLAAIVIFALADEPQQPQVVAATSTATGSPFTVQGPYPEIKRVDLGDAKAAFDLNNAIFLDTRDAGVYATSHIPGAINIPYEEAEQRLGELDKTKWIIPYCT